MAKIFRKIRQGLVSENKVRKYILYAIGEIILVVIGILIALSINNRNTEALNRKAEKIFYKNIKRQLLDDASNIKGQIEFNNFYGEQFKYAISIIESNNRIESDSLSKIAVNVPNYSDFDRQGNIYETMVNSGDIKLVTNNEIIERLRRLEETYIYVNRMEVIHFDAVMSIIPSLTEAINLYSSKIENEEYIYSYRFQNALILSLKIMDEKEGVYNRALEEINEIITILENEIVEDE